MVASEQKVFSPKRLLHDAGALLLGRLATALCAFFQVPLILQQQGQASFGLWISLVALQWTAAGFDGGLGFAFQNRTARLLAEARYDEAGRLFRRLFFCFIIGALALLALFTVAVWGGVTFGLELPKEVGGEAQVRLSLLLTGLICAAQWPLSLLGKVALARQRSRELGLWTGLGSLLMLGLTALQPASLVGCVVASALPLLLPYLGLLWGTLRSESWLWRGPPGMPDFSGFFKESLLFAAPQLGAAFANAFIPVLVAVHAGLESAAVYGVLHRLFGIGQQLLSLCLLPAWPASTDAQAKQRHQELSHLFRFMVLLTVLGFFLPTLLLTPWVPEVLQFWLGPGAPQPGSALLWLCCAWNLLRYLGQAPATLLNGLGRLEAVALSSWLWLGLTWAVCATGLITSVEPLLALLCFCQAFFSLPFLWREAVRVLRSQAPKGTHASKQR